MNILGRNEKYAYAYLKVFKLKSCKNILLRVNQQQYDIYVYAFQVLVFTFHFWKI